MSAREPESIDVALTMQDMALLREALLPKREAMLAALAPFGLVTTWEAQNRIDDVIGKIITARCALKRLQSPDYNPAGDSECENEATDAEIDAWNEAHPDADLSVE